MACHETDGGITTREISLAQRGQVRQDVWQKIGDVSHSLLYEDAYDPY